MKKSNYALTTFGLRLREHRQANAVTMGDVADAFGIEPFEIAEFETGIRAPSVDYVRNVSSYLQLAPLDEAELVKLCSGKRNKIALLYYRQRKIAHNQADKALRSIHLWKPSLIRKLDGYIRANWRRA